MFKGVFLLISLACVEQVHAQGAFVVSARTREAIDQLSRENTQLNRNNPTRYEKKEDSKESEWAVFRKNIHGGYSVSIMGPRMLGNSNETYNVFLQDVAPVQLFHAFNLSYTVSEDLTIGASQTGVQNLYDNVVGLTGNTYLAETTWFDPTIFFNLPNLISVPGFNVFTSASFSLSVTRASQEIGRITTIELSQGWTVDNAPSPWTYGFNWTIRPQFYTDPIPAGFTDRQTFSGSAGHQLGYRVSPVFALNSTSTFDFEHRDPDPKGSGHFGSNLEDRARISCSITPQLASGRISFGGYFQFLIFKAQPETSIIGGDFSIGF